MMAKDERIDNPTGFLLTNVTIADFIVEIIGARSNTLYFTRLSLKHLAEKGQEGKRLLDLVPQILESPDEIRRNKDPERFLISKAFLGLKKNRPQTINLEVSKENGNVAVTAFQSNAGYLQNFELLWRTAGDARSIPFSPSQQPP